MDPAQLRLVDLLEPHLTNRYKQETKAERRQARKDLGDENRALLAKLRCAASSEQLQAALSCYDVGPSLRTQATAIQRKAINGMPQTPAE